MIEFKKNVEELLPYNRKNYKSRKKWYGVSFQLPGVSEGKDIGLNVFVDTYKNWFEKIIIKLDNDSLWIVNHNFLDEDWFPNNEQNLKDLRNLFVQNSIPNTFTGALVFTTNDLLRFTSDLISYPYAVLKEEGLLYNDLDISNSKLQVVIKVSGHLNIDILSTNKVLLKEIVNENYTDNFIVREYRGTEL